MNKLRQKILDALDPLAKGRLRYAYLDYPHHHNIGDSAIWVGAAALLRDLHRAAPDYVSHWRYPPETAGRVIPEDGVLYLHGGGNFGDIWPHHQRYREAVIRENPRHRIVQLPQSVHFKTKDGLEAARRAIGSHRDFHLLVRDHKSHDFCVKHFDCPVLLAPDTAFGIDMASIPRIGTPQGLTCLFRTDKERRADAAAGQALFPEEIRSDWCTHGRLRRRMEKLAVGAFIFMPRGVPVASARFNAMARARVLLGFPQLDAAEVVVTDRLHGHIMATLLGKPHVVIDNFYGKIANFINAWGADKMTLQARSYEEAFEMAQSLMKQVRQGQAA